MANKIAYLLSRWTQVEWSGPAWYSYRKGKDGFPTSFKLEYFLLLDKGSAGETEWEGEDFAKALPGVLKKYPKLRKSVVGNIHSHHSMGAFFSATDEELLEQNAAKAFYPSLVVASSKTPFAFAISYLDQYNQPHIIESDEKDIIVDGPKPKDEWVKEADEVEKKCKSVISTGWNWKSRKGGSLQQQTMFLGGQEANQLESEKEIEEWNESFNYSSHYDDEEEINEWLFGDPKFKQWSDIMEKVELGELDTIQANAMLAELKLDWEGNPIE